MNVAIVAAAPDPGPAPTAEPRSPTVAPARRDRRHGRRRRRSDHRVAPAGPRSTASPATRTSRRRRCGRRSPATRCSPLPPTSSTRRRPWPSTPRPTFTRELLRGRGRPRRGAAGNPPAALGLADGHGDQHRRGDAAAQPRLPPARARPRTIYDALEGSIGGYLDTTLAVERRPRRRRPVPGDGASTPPAGCSTLRR